MARTLDQWKAQTYALGESNGLSSSETAEWKLYADVSAGAAFDTENSVEKTKQEIKDYVDLKQPYSIFIYPDLIKEFQNGDNLVVTNGKAGYTTIDPSKQIVTNVTVTEEQDGELRFKVAKTVGGEKVQLTATEFNNLKAYIQKRRAPGVKFVLFSLPADVLTYRIEAKFNTLYTEASVNDALLDALLSFQDNFRYDGYLIYGELYTVLKSVPGVESLNLEIDVLMGNGTNVTDMEEYVELSAGYFNYDDVNSSIELTPMP